MKRTGILGLAVAAMLAGCGGIEGDEVLAPREALGGFFGAGLDGIVDAAGGSVVEIGDEITYTDTIEPILLIYCSECHNGASPAGGLDVTSYDALLLAGVITPGDADGSEMVIRVEEGSMPPVGTRPPSPEEIGAIRTWVDEGAPNN